MDIAQKVQELNAPESAGMEQYELMIKTDREYKKMIKDGILLKPERQVASSMEISSIYLSCPQKH
jgi:hypothetical protein